MRDYLPSDINEEEELPVRGSLLAWLIERVRLNRWRTGWGLISEKGAAGGIISLDRSVLPDVVDRQWRGKVTLSSSTSEEHTVQEVNASDELITTSNGGRVTTNAKAHNGRKGVPEDTIVMVEESDYTDGDGNVQCYFDIPDGLTTNPADLTSTAATARTDDFDIEVQGGENGAEFDAARVYVANNDFSVFHNPITVDSSGFVTTVDAEIQGQLVGDTVLATLEGHIQIGSYSGGPANSKKIMLGPPLADQNTLLIAPGSGITINGSASAAAEVEFDGSGRALIANGGGDQTITIAATGGGAADGQGYEQIEVNDTLVQANTDDGVLNFDDTSNSGTTLGVEFSGAVDGVNAEQVNITATVDASGLAAGDVGAVEVVDYMIRVDEFASTGLKTLDSTDHSGMTVETWVAQASGTTLATWQNSNGNTMTNTQNYRIGESHTSDVILATGLGSGGSRLLIDQSDGSKLKLELNGVPVSGFFDFMRIRVKRGTSKDTPADLDFDF